VNSTLLKRGISFNLKKSQYFPPLRFKTGLFFCYKHTIGKKLWQDAGARKKICAALFVGVPTLEKQDATMGK